MIEDKKKNSREFDQRLLQAREPATIFPPHLNGNHLFAGQNGQERVRQSGLQLAGHEIKNLNFGS